MAAEEILGQGGILSSVDSGLVLSILFIAAIAIWFIGKQIRARGKNAKTEPAAITAPPGTGADIIAAITAAVNEYRKNGSQ